MVNKRESEKNRIKNAKEYLKKNLLKQILKQKVYELGIIPLCIAFIWYVPYWLGFVLINITGESWYLSGLTVSQEIMTRGDFWVVGIFMVVILAGFIWVNVVVATNKLERKAAKKFDVSRWDL